VLTPRQFEKLRIEFQRLGVPSHEGGRLWTFDTAELTGAQMLRRLRHLPDGAGITAVNAALCATQSDEASDSTEAAT
jgi:hypothetical protein